MNWIKTIYTWLARTYDYLLTTQNLDCAEMADTERDRARAEWHARARPQGDHTC